MYSVCDSFKDFLASALGGTDGILDPKNTTLGSVRGKLCIIQSYDGMSVPQALQSLRP